MHVLDHCAMWMSDESIGGMSVRRLEFNLDNWRRWMRDGVVTDGLPGRALLLSAGGVSVTFDEMVDEADKRCAAATDAIINGLTPAERAAINCEYLHAVFQFPRNNLPELLLSARTRIAQGLVRRGIY